MDTRLNIFTKNKTSRVHTRFSVPVPIHQISSLLPFTCTTERYENNNSARVSWTKLESANILFKQRRQGNMGSLLDQQCKWEPLNIFIMVFPSVWLNKRKRKSEKYTEIFWSFWFSESKQMKREKQKWEKLFTWESSQQVKEEQGNLFGFLFLVLQKF